MAADDHVEVGLYSLPIQAWDSEIVEQANITSELQAGKAIQVRTLSSYSYSISVCMSLCCS